MSAGEAAPARWLRPRRAAGPLTGRSGPEARAAGHVSAPLLPAAGPLLPGVSHAAGFREGRLIST